MKKILSLCVLFLAFTAITFPKMAEARVDILPRKILIDDRARSADITIMNLGDKPGIVRVSLISYRQDEKGLYHLLEMPLNPAFDPEKVVRFSPKQFSLPAGGRQKIRLSIQRPADLPDGEYRFHVKAISYDSEDEMNGKRGPADKGKNMAIKMNIAVAIPVVVRKGDLTSTAKMENVTILAPSQNQYNKPTLQFDVVRTGTAGVMGKIQALWEVAGKEPVKIGMVSNINVFSEAKKRTVQIPLEQDVQGSGTIRLIYTNEFGDKGVLDEIVMQK